MDVAAPIATRIALSLVVGLVGIFAYLAVAGRILSRSDGAHWTERARAVYSVRAGAIYMNVGVTFGAGMSTLVALDAEFGPALVAVPLVPWVLQRVVTRWEERRELRPKVRVGWTLGGVLLTIAWLALYVTLVLTLPSSYDGLGFIWPLAAAALLLFVGFGGLAITSRWAGSFETPRAEVESAVRRACEAAGAQDVVAYEIKSSRANAYAFPWQCWVVFTHLAADHLAPDEVEAIALHELEHLGEPVAVKAVRTLRSLCFLPCFAFVPWFDDPTRGFLFGAMAGAVAFLALSIAFRSREDRADQAAARTRAGGAALARGLERLHEANLTPVVLRLHSHSSVYDRMLAAGVEPTYPRPKPPTRTHQAFAWLASMAIIAALEVTSIVLVRYGF